MKTEKFVLTIEYGKKDDCGNPIPTKTAGELRKIIQNGIDNAESITVDEIQGDGGKLELRNEIRNIITTFFKLDKKGNPTIPTTDDVGEIDEIEYSSAVVDRIWRLVK